ncbi:putative Transmembrane protein [Melia azedarach]|uniref:Transmembrane protein n=1 Tax=Melia azedarach TaxID=155640 RepID=A0ACC1YUU2_MELAZ|nr:putative Transmembrane protein [Melia azedarach]
MLMGHTDGLSERQSSQAHLLADPELEVEEDDDDENGAADNSEEILYEASFEELADNTVKYDTIIWVSISLLLVLAWGVGIFMLLYLPIRRYVLRKDILSRKLYITPSEIVYKVSRPSFIPFWGKTTIEKHVPLSLVIDVIIEQGCLQSVYGIHTFRVESIAHGKAAPVDELQVQGVGNPGLLRKVIVTEAAKVIQDAGRNWKHSVLTVEGESMPRTASLTEGPAFLRSPSRSWKMVGSPHQASVERRGIAAGEMILQKLNEVNKSVEKIKLLVEKSKDSPRRKLAF